MIWLVAVINTDKDIYFLSASFIAKDKAILCYNLQMLDNIKLKSSITQSILNVLSQILQGDGQRIPLRGQLTTWSQHQKKLFFWEKEPVLIELNK